jgi:hypothetical protein
VVALVAVGLCLVKAPRLCETGAWEARAMKDGGKKIKQIFEYYS